MNCPKCQGTMESGFILDSCSDGFSYIGAQPACWVDPNKHKLGAPADPEMPGQYEIDSYRCTDCGFLELYAGGTSQE